MADNSNGSALADSPLNLLGTNGNVHKKVISNSAGLSKAFAIAFTGNIGSINVGDLPLFFVQTYIPGDSSQIWIWDADAKTIQNLKTNLYAYPEKGKLAADSRVLVGTQPYQWEVQLVDVTGGLYSIGSGGLYWTVEHTRNWSPIVLKRLDVSELGPTSLFSLAQLA